MKQQLISIINGVDIVTVERDGEIFVPIKPVCEAIGVDAKAQRAKLQEDEFFASTGAIITSVAADEKARNMFCIRLRDVYGWLATIHPGKVAPEAREAVARYRRECYDALYEHFTCSMRRTIETNNLEIDLLKQVAEDALTKLRSERLNPRPTLF